MCGTGGVTGGAESSTGGADSNPTSNQNQEEIKEEIDDAIEDVSEDIEDVKEEVTTVGETFTDLPKDMESTLTDISGEAVGALNNAVAVGTSLSKQINTALKRQGMMGGMSGYDETLEDPTLAGRRRRGRRRGNEKDVRSGALKIPSSSVGVQIPA
tara:strand:- start:837 stop:1304 length:468 start_codon:yes stop_codon:yes gene_type:complete